MSQLYAVEDSKGKKEFFDLKQVAKTYRDKLIAGGFASAHVTFGPDHPKHKANRRNSGWNKGRHPKRKTVTKAASKAFGK